MRVAASWLVTGVRVTLVAVLLLLVAFLPACYRMTDEFEWDRDAAIDASNGEGQAGAAGTAGEPMDGGIYTDGGTNDGGPGNSGF